MFLNERCNVGSRFPLGSMETKGIAAEFDSRVGDHNEVSNIRGCDLSTEHTGGDSNDMEGGWGSLGCCRPRNVAM
jgi:hypothetical protein